MIAPQKSALDALSKAAAALSATGVGSGRLTRYGNLWHVLTDTRVGAFYLALGLAVGVLVYRFSLLSSQGAPPGTDVGNWLALGYELFGGDVKAATVPYPPVVPGLVRAATLALDTFPAVTLVGVAISVVAGLPFFFLVRHSAGNLWALLFTPALLFLGYSAEMLAWGGYPQMLTQALLLLTLLLLGKGLLEGRRTLLWLAAVSSAVSVGTSVLSLTFLVVTVPLFVVVLMVQARLNWRHVLLRLTAFGAVTGALSMMFLPVYLSTYELREGRIWNPQGYSIRTSPEAFGYIFKELPGVAGEMKLILPLALVIAAYIARRRGDSSLIGPVAISLMATGLLLFFTSLEVRTLSIFEIGLLCGLALVIPDGFRRIGNLNLDGGFSSMARTAILAAAVALVATVVTLGHQRTAEAMEWYLVLDDDVVEALEWLKVNADPGTVVAASTSPKGHQLAWLVEGVAKLPAYNGSDPRWLILTEERRQAAVARALLAGPTGQVVANVAEQHHIEYVFLDKRVKSNRAALSEAGFITVLDNATIQVLRAGALLTYPAPSWWPDGGVAPDNALDVAPDVHEGTDLQKESSYVRLWYVMARQALSSVVGDADAFVGSDQAQTLSAASVDDLLDEIDALIQAEASGVVGDSSYPEYDFRLWLAFGRPTSWPPSEAGCAAATSISPPEPPSGASTEVVQRWYSCNRAKYATVYLGEEDADPSTHDKWARRFDDAELISEVMLLRAAQADGVVGSREQPFEAFEQWKTASGR